MQFEDPDFNNQLCNLTDIKDLPVDRATLKVLFTADDASDSTLDTASLPSVSSGDSVEWPDPFPIPQFSHDVELQLKIENSKYAKDGSVLVIPKGLKTDILDTLEDCMSKITAYPERQHYENVAKATVEKHPCLRDPGSEKGWFSWFHSLKFKLGNYRQKLSAAGCPAVVVNKRKAGGSKGKRVNKSKKGEVNYCPDPPEGHSLHNMEEKRKIMEIEMLKRAPDHHLLENLMVATFSQRRQEIIGDQPHITELISRWPALFHERQVITQLCNISTKRFNHIRLDTVCGPCPIEKYVDFFMSNFLRLRQNSRGSSPQTLWKFFLTDLMASSQDCWRYIRPQPSLERSRYSKRFWTAL